MKKTVKHNFIFGGLPAGILLCCVCNKKLPEKEFSAKERRLSYTRAKICKTCEKLP